MTKELKNGIIKIVRDRLNIFNECEGCMYKTHEYISEINNDDILWKYMDLSKFLSLLTTQKAWFTRLDKFTDDVYEGRYPKANIEKRPLIYSDEFCPPQEMYDKLEQIARTQNFVWCFHQSKFESAAMWKLYAKDNGIAIKTIGRKLKQAFKNEEKDIYITPITYIDYSEDFMPEGFAFYGALHKRKSFEYEKEVRCLYFENDNVKYKDKGGLLINISLDELIDEIMISPYAQTYIKDSIQSVINKYGLNFTVTKSSLNDLY